MILLVIVLCYCNLLLKISEANLITHHPMNMTVYLCTNVTFSCHGNGKISWEINGQQVQTEQQVQFFAQEKVYVPLPTPSVSQLIMTATEMSNFTWTVRCLVDPGNIVEQFEKSDPVDLLVYDNDTTYCTVPITTKFQPRSSDVDVIDRTVTSLSLIGGIIIMIISLSLSICAFIIYRRKRSKYSSRELYRTTRSIPSQVKSTSVTNKCYLKEESEADHVLRSHSDNVLQDCLNKDLEETVKNVAYVTNNSQSDSGKPTIPHFGTSQRSTNPNPPTDKIKSSTSNNLTQKPCAQQTNTGQYEMIELMSVSSMTEQRSTDPESGYSNLMRPEKQMIEPSSQKQDLEYESVNLHPSSRGNVERPKCSGLKFVEGDSRSGCPTKHTSNTAKIPPKVPVSRDTSKMLHQVAKVSNTLGIVDFESGYSLLTDTRSKQPIDVSALYGTLNFND